LYPRPTGYIDASLLAGTIPAVPPSRLGPQRKRDLVTAAEIVEVLGRDGPLTGAELIDRTQADPLLLWRACRTSAEISRELVGRRYLRLDRTIEGWARLSPSIRREFLTYTVVGRRGQEDAISARAGQLARDGDLISRAKSYLARDTMASVLAELGMDGSLAGHVTFIIAGDVTYQMAHAVPRPESSTGQLVRGSDLDIIVVADDDFPAGALRELDSAIYRKKHVLLVSPRHHEEIDYVVKRVAQVRRQLRFDTFQHCVAAKILHEGEMLCGSREVFEAIKTLVAESGVPAKLGELERQAAAARAAAEDYLLADRAAPLAPRYANHFYSRDEHDEIY
jgi:hypothetical protein